MHVRSIAASASVLIASLLFVASASARSCPDVPARHAAVVETLRAMYAAAATDKFSGLGKVIAPGFYAFDQARRYDGIALFNFVKAYQDKGYVFAWNVTDPAVHTACNMAWIAYTNVGSVTDPSGKVTPMKWLESAVLRKYSGRWLIRFFQSTRVPPPPARQ
jgi:hypothetical protein